MKTASFRRFGSMAVLVFALVSAGGCKKERPRVPPPPTPLAVPTIQFSADPTAVAFGSSVTLTWSTTDASEVRIDPVGKFPPSGSAVIKPERTTTYVATAVGPTGQASSSVTVMVSGGAAQPPPDGGAGGKVPDDSGKPGIEESSMTPDEIFSAKVRDVFFDFDRSDVNEESRQILRENAKVLTESLPSANIVIEGHCDERGSEEYNLALGDKRATSARDYLVSQGVKAGRIQTISYGKERPLDGGHTEDAYSKNRRAHFVLAK